MRRKAEEQRKKRLDVAHASRDVAGSRGGEDRLRCFSGGGEDRFLGFWEKPTGKEGDVDVEVDAQKKKTALESGEFGS